MSEPDIAANATAALERLKAEAADIRGEIDQLHTRLEIVEEVIGMLVGAKRGRPKGSGRKVTVPVEPVDAMPELEIADAGAAKSPAME